MNGMEIKVGALGTLFIYFPANGLTNPDVF